ncbi:MAG: A/G-specific adenine glycosylase [Acetobacteraceae bacterium]
MTAARELLLWYDGNRRLLPWRAAPGQRPDPYHVWLSEVMLQQTTATAAAPYYARFLARFPSFGAVAAAEETEVLAAWAGLGYYARARNLWRAARQVTVNGELPREPAALATLPGIGAYMAAAIAAIAFDVPVVPVDGNVARVLARRSAVERPLPGAMRELGRHARALADDIAVRARPGDFAQALFDLGATVCTPKNPDCGHCPWREGCAGRAAGMQETLPRKRAKKPRPQRFGAHFWLTDRSGRVLLRRRPEAGLLGGMTELPGTEWCDRRISVRAARAGAPMAAEWQKLGVVRHGFTHFKLEITLYAASVRAIAAPGFLCARSELSREALPSVMRKCCLLAERVSSELACA